MNDAVTSPRTRVTNALLTGLLGLVIIITVFSASAPGVIDLINGKTTIEKVATDTLAEVKALAGSEQAPTGTVAALPDAPEKTESNAALAPALPKVTKSQIASGVRNDDQAMSSSLIGIDFDLATQGAVSSAPVIQPESLVAVQKSVFANGSELGSLTVQIDPAARPYLDRAELKELLARAGVSTARLDARSSSELLSFTNVRDAGIDLRYDPIEDSITLSL